MKRLCVLLVLAALIISMSSIAFSAAVKYKEAPALAALVKAKKLPPLAQRLPASRWSSNPWSPSANTAVLGGWA